MNFHYMQLEYGCPEVNSAQNLRKRKFPFLKIFQSHINQRPTWIFLIVIILGLSFYEKFKHEGGRGKLNQLKSVIHSEHDHEALNATGHGIVLSFIVESIIHLEYSRKHSTQAAASLWLPESASLISFWIADMLMRTLIIDLFLLGHSKWAGSYDCKFEYQ